MAAQGFHAEEIVACGGATKSRAWMQMHADVAGVPITLTEVGDAVAIQDAADNMVHVRDTIEPNAQATEEYQFYVDQYCESYPALQDLTHTVVDHEAAK
ncbi:autoinducer-2 (AI-2) kinase [Mycobacteroides abscessus subsp. abscessus]|nr:autoinducer-2 (AI-2) kinase [Mycobacteroides abscessus subsp. abscessus]